MAITYVAKSTLAIQSTTAGGSQTLAVSVPAGVQAGDLLILVGQRSLRGVSRTASDLGVGSGWTQLFNEWDIPNTTGDDWDCGAWYRIATSSEPST